jgi:hypothetical protein
MRGLKKKIAWVWIATLALSGSALADSVSQLRRELGSVQAPVRAGELKMSQFRSGAGLTCELARKHLPGDAQAAPTSRGASGEGTASRAL